MTTGQLQGLRLTFIGSGTMAGAIIHTLVNSGEVAPADVVASDVRVERGHELHAQYGVRNSTDNVAAVQDVDVVVLSVKPQVLPYVMPELRGRIPSKALVFSIVAGMPIATIRAGLDHDAIVRVMPNTPAQIGEAMSVWTGSSAVTEAQHAQARTILQTMGVEMYVTREDALNMATAVSGTGPTYVFLLMEAC